MSDDWWNRLYPGEPGGEGPEASGTLPGEKKHDDTDAEHHALVSVSPSVAETATPVRTIAHPSRYWQNGVEVDPYLKANPAHTAPTGGMTPEEAAELHKHEEKLKEEPEFEAPPKPEYAPESGRPESDPDDVSDDTPESEDTPGEESKGWKEKVADARKKASAVTSKVAEKTAPARKGVASGYNAVSPSNGAHWSFLWSVGAAWAIGPQTPIALIDRLATFFGSPRPLSGMTPMDWGLLHGPGVWFADRFQHYWETGTMYRLVMLAAIGVFPVLLAQFADRISSARVRKAFGWVGYGFPVFFICSVSYIPAMGFHDWNELYVTLLFAAAWWGFSFSRTVGPGPVQFFMRIPLAAVVFGLISYSPGALF